MQLELLKHTPKDFITESVVNNLRIYKVIDFQHKSNTILYLCEREIRAIDNFALQFALQKSKELNLSLKIIHPKINFECKQKQFFIDNQILKVKKNFENLNLDFEIINKTPYEIIKFCNPSILIIDFNPILNRDYLKNLNCQIYEIDGHNIIPARYISNKQEYNASTFRRKIYNNIYPFLTEYDNLTTIQTEAEKELENFIKNKLPIYADFKNNPPKNALSGLSKYINLGFISSQRITLEILKSKVTIENKEAFLEELIIRKELADNFCLYNKKYKTINGIPQWAKNSLNFHKNDLRPYLYSIKEFENAKTHDNLWNATQNQLIKEGKIHGYLRMYWAKKILEWTITPQRALEIAIYLNDKYAFDSPSPNGYVGILWALGGLHDRAFQDWYITGKIRRMTFNSLKKKFDVEKYIKKYLN